MLESLTDLVSAGAEKAGPKVGAVGCEVSINVVLKFPVVVGSCS